MLGLLIYKMVLKKHLPYGVIEDFNKKVYVNHSYKLMDDSEQYLASIITVTLGVFVMWKEGKC